MSAQTSFPDFLIIVIIVEFVSRRGMYYTCKITSLEGSQSIPFQLPFKHFHSLFVLHLRVQLIVGKFTLVMKKVLANLHKI